MNKDETFLTVVGAKLYLGMQIFKKGSEFYLVKELDNEYDDEAICVKTKDAIQVGYIANSIHTVAKGTKSAGRIYDAIKDHQKVVVRFVVDSKVIVEVVEDAK